MVELLKKTKRRKGKRSKNRSKSEIKKQQRLATNNNAAADTILAHPTLLDPGNNKQFLSDRQRLLQFLPQEVWLLILAEVKGVKNIQNISNSSLFFRSLLQHTHTEHLFPSVYQILGGYIESGLLQTVNAKPNDNDEHVRVCPCCNRQRCQQRSETLKLRLVCKTWCEGVDSFYQCHPNTFLDVEDPKLKINSSAHWRYHVFPGGNGSVQAAFLKKFEDTHDGDARSPFVANAITLFLDNDAPVERVNFLSQNREILRKYGKHVKYLKIHEARNCDLLESYARLYSMLHRMPNLEYLQVALNDTCLSADSKNILKKLVEKIKLFPLPKLSKLEKLAVYSAHSDVFSELVRSNAHIGKLLLITSCRGYYQSSSYSSNSLANLTQLNLNLRSYEQLGYFRNAQFVVPLVRLRVSFGFTTGVDFCRFFSSIYRMCGKTLETLILTNIPQGLNNSDVEHAAGVSFKNLKRLRLTLSRFYSLDFLLLMKDSLEYLDVVFVTGGKMAKRPKKVDQGRKVKFFGCVKNPFQSNIWSVFPHLKRVRYFEAEESWEEPTKIWDVCRWDFNMKANLST